MKSSKHTLLGGASRATRLPKCQRLLGRVVCVEAQDILFTCYLVCGPTRKQLIQIEAWQTLKQRAADQLREGQLVSLTNVALSMQKAATEEQEKLKEVFHDTMDQPDWSDPMARRSQTASQGA